jgi:hypothetical protein
MSHWNPSSGWEHPPGRRADDHADAGTDQAGTDLAGTDQAGTDQAGSAEQAGSADQPYPRYEAGPGYPGGAGLAPGACRGSGGHVPGFDAEAGGDGTWDQPWAGSQPAQHTWPPAQSANPYPEPPAPEQPMSPAPIWEDPLPRTQSPPPMWEDQQPPKAYLRQQPEPPGPPGHRARTVVITLLVIVLLAAAGSAVALELRSHGGKAAATPSQRATASQPASPASPQPSRPAPTPVRSTARPSPPAGPPVARVAVAVAPAAARNPAAASVASFLTSYFTAINAHDYQRFAALLDRSMQQVETPQRFAAGFRSTTDSGAVLIGLAPVTGGRLAAIVQFTSHQSPADSPDHLACTHWTITLYLLPGGTGYLLGAPPPGYQASHQSC